MLSVNLARFQKLRRQANAVVVSCLIVELRNMNLQHVTLWLEVLGIVKPQGVKYSELYSTETTGTCGKRERCGYLYS